MARTFDQILAEVNAKSDPQKAAILQQIGDIPNQTKAEEDALAAKQTASLDEILAGARRRGLGFSGIPIAEQAQYNATDYMPAVARVRSDAKNRQYGFQTQLNDLERNNYVTANDLFNQDRSFEEQKRQFDLEYALKQQAAADARRASSSVLPSFGLPTPTGAPAANQPSVAELDAQYLGRLRAQYSGSDLTMMFNSLKNGSPDAKRRYALAVQLGYVKPDTTSNIASLKPATATLPTVKQTAGYNPLLGR